MKRVLNNIKSTINSTIEPEERISNLSLKDIKSVLPDMKKQDLVALIEEASKILETKQAKAASKLVLLIPNEVWIEIFRYGVISLRLPNQKEQLPRKLTHVCRLWSNIVREIIPLIIKDLEISEWILTQFPSSIEVLHLHYQGKIIDGRFCINNKALLRLTNLKELSLYCNAIIKSETVKKLTSLTKLNLSDNMLISDDAIRDLTNLQSLSLNHNNHITNEGIRDLTNLKWLSLQFICDANIDESALLKLTNLEYLDIQATSILKNSSYPLKKLTKLTTLYANSNVSNESISLLANLTYLSNYSLQVTNTGIEKLVNLRTLDLDSSKGITYEGLSKLSKLDTLILFDSELADEDLTRMTNLTSLSFAKMNITDRAVQSLTNLVYLDLDGANTITDDAISHLTSLTHLRLNDIITNEGIRNLTNLKILHLCDNRKISDYGLEKLTNLEKLSCYDANRNKCLEHISQVYLTKLV